MSDATTPPGASEEGAPSPRRPGVNRLLDMLVEEVSLVDRAANKHRFLVVKRESGMSKKKPAAPPEGAPATTKESNPKKPAAPGATKKADETPAASPPAPPAPVPTAGGSAAPPPAAPADTSKAFPPKKKPAADADEEEEDDQAVEPGTAPAAEDKPAAGKPPKKATAKDANGQPELDAPQPGGPDDEEEDDESPLGIAVATIDSLTQAVELLSDDPVNPGQFGTIADQLRAAADAISAAAGIEPDGDENMEPPGETTRDGLIDSIQELLLRVSTLTEAISASPRGPATAPTVTTETQAPPDMAGTLDQVTQSLKSVESLVKAQAERLSVIEKRVGVPNSQPAGERVTKRDEQEVSWPMDMNRPRDRASVSKDVSFHDD